MKRAIKYFLVWMLLSMATQISYAQASSTNGDLPRLLERKVRWMEKQGFPAREYQWGDSAINEHLRQALAYRKPAVAYTVGGSTLAGSGTILSTVGLLGLAVGVIVNAINWSDEDEDLTRYGVMGAAGLAATGGGVLMIVKGANKGQDARYQLRKARDLYPPR